MSCQNVWEKKPVDFTRKLYKPHPPKRNTRESIRPEQYDRFLRSSADESIFWEKPEEKKKANEQMLESSFFNESFENWKKDFETQFRIVDPLAAKIQASKAMSFREGLDTYRNPRDHDFRGVGFYVSFYFFYFNLMIIFIRLISIFMAFLNLILNTKGIRSS